jgi:hypothetical protein
MQSKHSFMEYADRYLFDNTLLHQGYHQVDSEQDAWYYGHWLNPKTLERSYSAPRGRRDGMILSGVAA